MWTEASDSEDGCGRESSAIAVVIVQGKEQMKDEEKKKKKQMYKALGLICIITTVLLLFMFINRRENIYIYVALEDMLWLCWWFEESRGREAFFVSDLGCVWNLHGKERKWKERKIKRKNKENNNFKYNE